MTTWSSASSPAPVARSAPAWTSRPSCGVSAPPSRAVVSPASPSGRPQAPHRRRRGLRPGRRPRDRPRLRPRRRRPTDAKFGIPEVKRGLVAAGGGVLRLPSRLPYHVAMELALTGDSLDAPRAHHFGLVNRLGARRGPRGARSLAAEIAANGPLAVRATKKVIVESRDWPAAEAFSVRSHHRPRLRLRRRPRGRPGLRREAPAPLDRAVGLVVRGAAGCSCGAVGSSRSFYPAGDVSNSRC